MQRTSQPSPSSWCFFCSTRYIQHWARFLSPIMSHLFWMERLDELWVTFISSFRSNSNSARFFLTIIILLCTEMMSFRAKLWSIKSLTRFCVTWLVMIPKRSVQWFAFDFRLFCLRYWSIHASYFLVIDLYMAGHCDANSLTEALYVKSLSVDFVWMLLL